MLLRFTKMHGCGNDFVVLDLLTQHFQLKDRHVRKLADRHFGIGCDQVLVVEAPTRFDVDFRYRIFNADGSEVEQCGNGARCFARYVRDKRLTGKERIRVETLGGIIELHIARNKQVTVDMGAPRLEPEQIPMLAPARALLYPLQVGEQLLEIGAVSMGNPHAVLLVDDVRTAQVSTLGPAIETHSAFPQARSICASLNAAPAKRWRAAPAPAPLWSAASCAACWIARCRSICPAAALLSSGKARGSPL
jgi:diaminopimelate epimerase